MSQNMDMKAANQTYEGFIGFMKWGTIISFAFGALVVLLIST